MRTISFLQGILPTLNLAFFGLGVVVQNTTVLSSPTVNVDAAQGFPNAIPEAATYQTTAKVPGPIPDDLGMKKRIEVWDVTPLTPRVALPLPPSV